MVMQAWVAQWYSAYLTRTRPLVSFPAPNKQRIMILLHEIFTKIGIRLATGKFLSVKKSKYRTVYKKASVVYEHRHRTRIKGMWDGSLVTIVLLFRMSLIPVCAPQDHDSRTQTILKK